MKRFSLLCAVAAAFLLVLTMIGGGKGSATANNFQQQQGHTYYFSLHVHQVTRINQLDPAQYNSAQDYTLWDWLTCSTAAITEVLNAYGHHYRIADILKVEAFLDEITPKLGLVEDAGIARTASKFGFKTNWGYNLSYDQVIATANQGEPVIVGWPPSRYPGGHLVVVESGNSSTVFIADSSRFNRHILTRAQFLHWWAGFSAVVTPAAEGVQV
jgi:Peptidase C39 family